MGIWAACTLMLLCLSFLENCGVAVQASEDYTNASCEGVFLQYDVLEVTKIHPYLTTGSPDQPYKFVSELILVNMGFNEVKNWQAYVGFKNGEWLVSADNAILEDGNQLPVSVANGTSLVGYPTSDLQNSVETAGDYSKIAVTVKLTGTEFGAQFPNETLPANISLQNEGWDCGVSSTKLNSTSLTLCCKENSTAVNLTASTEKYLPLEKGDLNILYDVVQTYKDSYWAQVTISNDYQLGRLDGWNLTWEWQQGEFIYQMKGAQTLEQDQSDCLNGEAGVAYADMDFSSVMNCQRNPTIVDLPLDKENDTTVGNVKYCCRSGSLLPSLMDPTKTKSAFKLLVYKLPPNNKDRTVLSPPANFGIGPLYKCGQPRLVAPSEYPDSSNSDRYLSAVKSWQVTCNFTTTKTNRKCCVSFSTYFNDSIVPCKPCSCGCSDSVKKTCNASAEAMLISTDTLLLPSANRTSKAIEWAEQKHFNVPSPLPCSDYCGVSLNWHVVSDYTDGWSARMTIFNWEPDAVANWFAAIELDKAMPGYEKVYSFNGTMVPGMNNTLYMEGKLGYMDYLPGMSNTDAGKVQSVISFKKANTPKINVSSWDGFPTRVFFNGDECVIPNMLPTSSGSRIFPKVLTGCLLFLLILIY